MSSLWVIMCLIVHGNFIYGYRLNSSLIKNASENDYYKISKRTRSNNGVLTVGEVNYVTQPGALLEGSNFENFYSNLVSTTPQNELKRSFKKGKKLKRAKLLLTFKALLAAKLIFFAVIVPILTTTAKLLSWKAFFLSFLAFIISKITLLRNLVLGQNRPILLPPSITPIVTRGEHLPSKIYHQPVHFYEDYEEVDFELKPKF